MSRLAVRAGQVLVHGGQQVFAGHHFAGTREQAGQHLVLGHG
ncbi:MAG: hypothetical protein ACT4PZ_22720 [Panacagrimonas sp.]